MAWDNRGSDKDRPSIIRWRKRLFHMLHKPAPPWDSIVKFILWRYTELVRVLRRHAVRERDVVEARNELH
eukprot:2335739-Karenia_brevis.AAC.1